MPHALYTEHSDRKIPSAARVQKTALLDEMQTVTSLHRKYLIHLLRKERRPRTRQRRAMYDGSVSDRFLIVAARMGGTSVGAVFVAGSSPP